MRLHTREILMLKFDTVSERLKIARLSAGFQSAKTFCDKNNIPISTYYHHETGIRNISVKLAKKYSEILNLNLNWLLSGEGEPFSETQNSKILTSQEFFTIASKNNINKSHENTNHTLLNENNIDSEKISVYPHLFFKIILSIIDYVKNNNLNIPEKKLSTYSAEIYKEIILSDSDTKNQYMMISIAVKMFFKNKHGN